MRECITEIVALQEDDNSVAALERDAAEYVLHAVRGARAIVFERADNAKLWDVRGKEYLDTMSGSAGPAMVGHANPRVAAAVSSQMARLPSHNLRHDSVPVIEYCKRLAQIAPGGLSKSFLCPGGGDAIETALKFAIRVTGRPQVLSVSGAYHGMSLGALALGGMPALRSWFPKDMCWPNFRQIASADSYRPQLGEGSTDHWRLAARALEDDLNTRGAGKVAALVIELVQGPNGHAVFPQGYYQEVQNICRRHGVLLIVDEIQTGLARCGTMWACDHYGVRPDILVAGKALGGGVPIGVFMTRKDLIPDGLESEPWHYLTFMNQPLAASAGLAVLDVVKDEKLVERAQQLGAKATLRFREMAQQYKVIGDVRGPGLFIGVEYVEDRRTRKPATASCLRAWERAVDIGLVVQFGGIHANVLKFKPPLTTPAGDFAKMLDLCEELTAFIQHDVDRLRP